VGETTIRCSAAAGGYSSMVIPSRNSDPTIDVEAVKFAELTEPAAARVF